MRADLGQLCVTLLLLFSFVNIAEASSHFTFEFTSYPNHVTLGYELDNLTVRLHAAWPSYPNVGWTLDRLEGKAVTSSGGIRYSFSAQRCSNYGIYCRTSIAHEVDSADIQYSSDTVFLEPTGYFGTWLGSHETSPPVKLVVSAELILLDDGWHRIDSGRAILVVPVVWHSADETNYGTTSLSTGPMASTHTNIQLAGLQAWQILALSGTIIAIVLATTRFRPKGAKN